MYLLSLFTPALGNFKDGIGYLHTVPDTLHNEMGNLYE